VIINIIYPYFTFDETIDMNNKFSPLSFEVKFLPDQSKIGYYNWGTDRNILFENLNNLYAKWRSNKKVNINLYLKLCEEDESFFPALIMLAEIYLNYSQPLKARKILNKAIKIAESVIPKDFNGKIYSVEEPYSYFSALQGLVYCENKIKGSDNKEVDRINDREKRLSPDLFVQQQQRDRMSHIKLPPPHPSIN